MFQLFEFLPFIAFLVAYLMNGHVVDIGHFHYQFDGIYSATAVLMGATAILFPLICVWKRKLEKRLLWILAVTLVMGSATLIFHNPLFIQWKFTVVYWICGVGLLGSHFFMKKSVVQHLLGEQLELPDHVCKRLTFLWSGYFFIVGALNLVVAYHFSEGTWVVYKLWSSVAYLLIISIVTAVIAAPHLKVEATENDTIE